MHVQVKELQQQQAEMQKMYTQDHVDKLEREIHKLNLLLIKVQSKWQQAQLSSDPRTADSSTNDGGDRTPRPDWEEARQKLPSLRVPTAPLLFFFMS
jgi:hypothetical protein